MLYIAHCPRPDQSELWKLYCAVKFISVIEASRFVTFEVKRVGLSPFPQLGAVHIHLILNQCIIRVRTCTCVCIIMIIVSLQTGFGMERISFKSARSGKWQVHHRMIVWMHCIIHIAVTHTIQQSRSCKYFQGIWKSWGSMPLDLPSAHMWYTGIGNVTPTRPLPNYSKFHGYDHCTSCLNIMEIHMHFSAAWFSW